MVSQSRSAGSSAPLNDTLEVLYRDDRLIAVCKRSGMVVHRGWANDGVTAADVVRDQLVHQPVYAAHRLDRGTSGVLIFALDAEAVRLLQQGFESGSTKKRYIALVRGPMREACTLDHPVPARTDGERVPAVTAFNPLAHSGRWSLVEALPVTGRLHQIRRHLKHLSHPIVGDVRYGKGDVNRFFRENYDLNRLALHCAEIELTHPSGERLVLKAPVPQDLSVPLERLGICPLYS